MRDVARVHATAAGRVQCRRHQRLSLQVQLSMDKVGKRRQLQVIPSVDSSTVAIILEVCSFMCIDVIGAMQWAMAPNL